ncbi:hypothetical protein EYF80_027716 [Liparis tanakae]|uniref:Uncharacterized protein n=1 Tax=Liparis tanakae TaxID=230148 RepID=A0A4Z2H9W6_9TELE|nr:hypothetical protein EYF80_027716 [Liparis tanakae]
MPRVEEGLVESEYSLSKEVLYELKVVQPIGQRHVLFQTNIWEGRGSHQDILFQTNPATLTSANCKLLTLQRQQLSAVEVEQRAQSRAIRAVFQQKQITGSNGCPSPGMERRPPVEQETPIMQGVFEYITVW